MKPNNEQEEYVDIREVVKKSLPRSAAISSVEYEGPEVAIYSKAPKILIDDGDKIKALARKMRKRIVVRSSPEVRLTLLMMWFPPSATQRNPRSSNANPLGEENLARSPTPS